MVRASLTCAESFERIVRLSTIVSLFCRIRYSSPAPRPVYLADFEVETEETVL